MRRWTPVGLAALLSLTAAGGQPPPVTQPPPATPQPAMPAAQAKPVYPAQVGGKNLKGWLDELKNSPDGQMREAAVKAIPLFGPPARKEAFKPLIAAIKDSDSGVKINAILALGQYGGDEENNEVRDRETREITEALALAITNAAPGSPTRLYATRSLSLYGPDAENAIRAVTNIADDLSWETRAAVAQALGQLGRAYEEKGETKGPNAAALSALTRRLADEKSTAVRLEVVQALILLGPPKHNDKVPGDYVRAIKPQLDAVVARQKLEKEPAVQVWLLVLQMLYDGTAFTDDNIRKVGGYISKPDIAGRVAALRALALVGEKAKPALPLMADALRSEEPVCIAEAISALSALDKVVGPAVPDLEKFKAATKDEVLKAMATAAIDRIQGRKPTAPDPTPKK